jgi:radical SAM protein with 4Fe4S-binding SPASM domain
MNARLKGADIERWMIDRVVDQLRINQIETVNLGGNEPLFTNGPNPRDTQLPYIIKRLVDAGIDVGLTTSGVSLIHLYRQHRDAVRLLNDIDVSFDSPFEDEHNRNRGAAIYNQAIEALEICRREQKPHTIILCAMSWNFDRRRIDALVSLAIAFEANIRINPIKPTMPEHLNVALPPELYYSGFSRLMEVCDPLDLGEPPVAAVTGFGGASRCPCGRSSFRIHSISPDGRIFVSPCVYLHDYKAPLDLLEHDLREIIECSQFRVFRQRHANPQEIEGCRGCPLLSSCGGGCAARSFLYARFRESRMTFKSRDPYCPKRFAGAHTFPREPLLVADQRLVHMDYLCTWIGRPKRGDGGNRPSTS